MRKLPSRYRAGQSSIPSAGQDDDGNLVKSSVSASSSVPTAPVAAKAVQQQQQQQPQPAVIKLGSEGGVVLKRGSAASAPAPALDEEAAAAEAARRRAAARAKAKQQEEDDEKEQGKEHQKDKKKKASEDEDEEEDQAALDKILGQRALPLGKKMRARSHSDDSGSGDSSSDSSSGSSSSSSSSSGSDEEENPMPLMRPVFVSKAARTTVKNEAQIAAEEEAERLRLAEEEKIRVQTSKTMLAEKIAEVKNAAAAALASQKETVSVNVNDGDETEEFELWKVRELTRIKRERDERRVWEEQKAEIQRRRAMDDDEILAEDGDRSKGEKAQQKFLQRYYHKGVFYQDELEKEYGGVDFSAPTGVDADIQDKSLLPKVMQVRSKWALRGRTKYTHLTDQDTTYSGGLSNKARFGALPEEMVESLEKKRAGVGSVALPKEKKHKHKE